MIALKVHIWTIGMLALPGVPVAGSDSLPSTKTQVSITHGRIITPTSIIHTYLANRWSKWCAPISKKATPANPDKFYFQFLDFELKPNQNIKGRTKEEEIQLFMKHRSKHIPMHNMVRRNPRTAIPKSRKLYSRSMESRPMGMPPS